jgi:hypothetical protein
VIILAFVVLGSRQVLVRSQEPAMRTASVRVWVWVEGEDGSERRGPSVGAQVRGSGGNVTGLVRGKVS